VPGEPDQLIESDEIIAVSEPEFVHKHVVLSDGTEVCPAVLYMILSETMHARECHDVTTWESTHLLEPRLIPDEWPVPIAAVADAISLNLIQVGLVTSAVLSHMGERNRAATLANFRAWPHHFSKRQPLSEADEWWNSQADERPKPKSEVPEDGVTPNLASLMPLTPAEGLLDQHVSYLDSRRWTYLSMRGGHRPAGRLFRDDEMVTLAFDAHRFSSVQFAKMSLRIEAEKLGDSFDPNKLNERIATYAVVSELAAVASIWSKGTIAAALRLVASSLRSSYWLWLEDDDRAMACLRCVLEQSARIVATLKNPRRAERMENSQTLPSRWVEAAGWKRLSTLNHALGEYAHAQKQVDPLGPRLLLSALQMDVGEDDDDAILTARGYALTLVAEFAARAVVAVLRDISTIIADAAADLLEAGPFDLSEEREEQVLNHAWDLRDRR
jgi:hypothetical protein